MGNPLTQAPYSREQYANTFLHLLTLEQPRTDQPDFSPHPVVAAAAQPQARSSAPVSSLQLNQVMEVHAMLQRNHLDAAQQLDPDTVKTEQDASQFVAAALAVIHPEGAQKEAQGPAQGNGDTK